MSMLDPKIIFQDNRNEVYKNIQHVSEQCCYVNTFPNNDVDLARVCDSLKEVEDYLLPKEDLTKLVDSKTSVCGKLFKSKEPIYLCRDCETDSTCVLCRDCFLNSDHQSHNYELRSSNGGTCDCGDTEAWKKYPNCRLHSKDENVDLNTTVYNPDYVMSVEEVTKDIPKQLIIRVLKFSQLLFTSFKEIVMKPLEYDEEKLFLQSFDDSKNYAEVSLVIYNNEYHNYEQVISIFKRCLACSAEHAMALANIVDRDGRCVALITDNREAATSKHANIGTRSKNQTSREILNKLHVPQYLTMQNYMLHCLQWFYELIDKFPKVRELVCYNLLVGNIYVDDEGKLTVFHKSDFLKEVLFTFHDLWKFPRNTLTNFIMTSTFKDVYFKKLFAEESLENYRLVMTKFSHDDHNYEDSIVSMSCQYFTVISLAYYLVEHKKILHKLISIIYDTFYEDSKPLMGFPGILQFAKSDEYINRKFDAFDRHMRIFIDIRYIMRSILTQITGIAENNDSVVNLVPKTLSDKMVNNFIEFFDVFVKCLELLQDLNTIERITTHHVENDPPFRSGIFIMHGIVICLTLTSEFAVSNEQCWQKSLMILIDSFTKRVVTNNLMYLKNDFTLFGHKATVVDNNWPNKYISIIKPLHRLMAPLLTKKQYREKLSQNTIHFLTDQALQIVVFSSQQLGNMWVRSGTAPFILNQHMKWSYLFPEMYGRDLELLQEMACAMSPEEFLLKCVHKFDLKDYFNEVGVKNSENRAVLQRAEDFLHLIILTLFHRHRINVGQDITKDSIIKYVMFHILCIKKMPHSKFVKKLPNSIEILAKHKLNTLLDEISDQSTQSQIMLFTPKQSMIKSMYDRFCPYYTLQDRNEAELNIQNILNKNDTEPIFIPPTPIDLTEHFQNLYTFLTDECFLEILNRYLYFCTTQRIGVFWSDTILDLLVHLIGQCLLEDKKLFSNNGNPTDRTLFVDFVCSKNGKYDIIGNLETLCDKITNHHQLQSIKWTIRKWYEIKNRNSEIHETSDCQNIVVSMESEDAHTTAKLSKADAAKRRREQLMNKMQTMQKKFMNENLPVWNETSTGLEPPKSKLNVQKVLDPGRTGQSNDTTLENPGEESQRRLDDKDGTDKPNKTIQPNRDLVCIVCQEATNEMDKPIVAIAGAWRSTVLSSKGSSLNTSLSSQEPSELSAQFSESESNLEDDFNTEETFLNEHNRSNKSMKPSVVIPIQKNRTNIFITTCGHVMHYECQTQYLKNMIKQKKIFARSRGVMQPFIHNRCPLCKCVCNIDIPISREDLVWHYNSSELQLSYSEWLMEFSQWRPTKEIKISQNWKSNFKNAMFHPISLIKKLSVPPLFRAQAAPITNKDLLATFAYKTNIVTKLPNTQLKKEMHEAFDNLWNDMYPSTAQELLELCHSVSYTLRVWENIYSKESSSFIHNISDRHRDGLYFLIRGIYQTPVILSNHEQVNQNIQLYVELLQQLILSSKLSSWMDIFGETQTPFFIFEVNFFHLWCSLIFLRTLLQSRLDEPHKSQLGFLNKKTFNFHLTKLVFEFQSIKILISLSPANIDQDHEAICDNLIKYAPEMWNEESINQLYKLRERLIHGYPLMEDISPELSKSQVVVGFIQSVLPFLRCTSFLLTVLGDLNLCEDKGNEIYLESVALMNQLKLNLVSSELMPDETIPRRVRGLCDQLLVNPAISVDKTTDNGALKDFDSSDKPMSSPTALLMKSINWTPQSPARLIELPSEFTEIMTSCLKKGCSVNPQPTGSQYELAMCLLCGASVCLSGYCCRSHDYNMSSLVSNGAQLHARRAHAGYSLYMSSRTSKIIIVFYNARWILFSDPVYFDRFGEIDSELKRGNPLFLNKEAYRKLEKAWMEHKIGTVVQEISTGQDYFV